MFGCGNNSAAKAASYASQGYRECPQCKGFGYKNYYKQLEWYGDNKPKPEIIKEYCSKCNGHGAIAETQFK